MRTGFHTNALVWAGVRDIGEIAAFASDAGFDFLEVGPGIELDPAAFRRAAKRIGLEAFIYCRNFIDDDAETAKRERAELYRRMAFAGEMGATKFICSTGISRRLSLPDSGGCDPLKSLEPAAAFLTEALEIAKSNGLTLCLENCPMYRNIATSPLMWRTLFDWIPDPALGICYDASHFVWQMIDVYEPFEAFSDRIRHIHMKDTAIDRKKLGDVGILHNTAKERGFEQNQWWRHTVIGGGEIDWPRFLTLAGGLPGGMPALSFEMEDYQYECEPENVRLGLTLQLERLKTLERDLTAKA